MPQRVILYHQPGCIPCHRVMEFLSQRGVEYDSRDISKNLDWLDELINMGFMGTPVTIIDGSPVVGYDPNKLDQLLRDHGTEQALPQSPPARHEYDRD